MANWHIGCSGFHYKNWKGPFYPADLPQKRWFEFYSERFKTLELNVTFYKFPQLPMVQAWYEKSPADFNFSVKAPKGITHYKQFINCGQLLSDFYGVIQEGLKEKLGCVLFQMPPRMAYKEEKLDRIIEALDLSQKNVLEFRHETWWNAEVFAKLSMHNITFCGQSHPLLPDDVIQNNQVLYYRFHGVPDLYRSPYSTQSLQAFADTVDADKRIKEAFVYFNNDIEVWAVHNALELGLLAAGTKKAPSKKKTL
ncbi:DUF72 domain-containing protein [Aridibaculum aurantiacum]|uniref:DUF72 domain-containing protein n=1 Tax=Aridibaculum aurantiacum TaxID=2810307 RepID=UPI001A9566A2|nr:DUF72 domain-containing protein [Aridibaculum aurantiacum]